MPPRRQTYSQDEIAQLIAQGVATAMAARQPNTGSEDASNNTAPTAKPCSYKDFLACKPLSFKGTEGAIGLIQWFEKMESVFRISKCAESDRVQFATCTLEGSALSWWNSYANSVGIDTAYLLPWDELKQKLTAKYCSVEQLHKLEEEFWHLKVQGADIEGYTVRFQQLSILRPAMVSTEPDKIRKYIRGLPEPVRGNVASSNQTTIDGAIQLAHELMAMNENPEPPTSSSNHHKRKWTENANDQNQTDKGPATTKAYMSGSGNRKEYTGTKPFCSKCNRHHDGPCGTPCGKCKRYGHLARDCRMKACYECGNDGHFRSNCPKLKNNNNNA